MYKSVYVKAHGCFAMGMGIDCNEFIFTDVEIEDTANYLTIYSKDGSLAFKCRIADIDRFAKMEN